MVDLQSYKETGILWWMCRVIKKREYYGGCCRVIKKREYYGGCAEL